MSKRQEKIAENIKQQQEFIKERRKLQLSAFEMGVKLGTEFYFANKEGMSEEEQALIENEMEENNQLLEKLRAEVNGKIV